MQALNPELIHDYCTAHSEAEPDLLKELTTYTWRNTVNPRMLSGHLQGRYLAMISRLLAPDCILELGTFTGYSALCLAEGLQPGGKLYTIEADKEYAFKAGEFFKRSEFAGSIDVILGEAAQIIPNLKISPSLVFVDADKINYSIYLDLCLQLCKSGTLILFDNTLWSGKVLDPAERERDAETRHIHALNERLATEPKVQVVQLPLRDGLSMVRIK
jgi:caffeoyl-CoA O-methyltransferase